MSVSLPSKDIYVVDVPEIDDFGADFRYNFFVPDESVNASGGVPENVLNRPAGEMNSEFIQYAITRVPRYVEFKFTPPRIADVGDAVSELDERDNVFDSKDDNSLIADNLDKVLAEDFFASHNYVAVNFHDGEIQDKVHYLVSGTIEQRTLVNREDDRNVSPFKLSRKLRAVVPKTTSTSFLTRASGQPKMTFGGRFFANKLSSKGSVGRHRRIKNSRTKRGIRIRQKIRWRPPWYTRLRHVSVNAQINSKLLHDIVDKAMDDPASTQGDSLIALSKMARRISSMAKRKDNLAVDEKEFKTPIVPYIEMRVQNTANQTQRRSAELVGYIIDKVEIGPHGEVINHEPIVIDNPKANSSLDVNIRYSSRYQYKIRTIARFTLPAIDVDTGDSATIQILASSKPSSTVYVRARETEAPPPPADLNFTWDYERDKLLIHWAFPPNSQRDIKKFQVFRRKAIEHPFELIKMYDFDDSAVRYEDRESPHPRLVEFINSPVTFFIDSDFDRLGTSRYIYTVAAIDAHGFSSNYAAQFEVWFNKFENRVEKKLISHSGAPKPYPNLYLEADTFVDTIRVSGPNSKRMRLYLNPEYFYLVDGDDEVTKVLQTKQDGGSYRLQFINMDNQQSETIAITIDDRISLKESRVDLTKKRFGRRRAYGPAMGFRREGKKRHLR